MRCQGDKRWSPKLTMGEGALSSSLSGYLALPNDLVPCHLSYHDQTPVPTLRFLSLREHQISFGLLMPSHVPIPSPFGGARKLVV